MEEIKIIPVIIFLGPPGAGKGTQALRLSRVKSIPKISTGDMLRHAVQEDSDLGRKVKSIMAEGALVDDETMLNLVADRIARPDSKDGFILDGYPRNIHQAAQLEKVLRPHMQICVVVIDVPEAEIIKRVAGRRTCPQCERIYNVHFHPPKADEVCDVDGTKLFRRQDDQERVVRKRLTTYRKETLPLIEHYKKRGVLQVVNGVHLEEEVGNAIASQVRC
ncbi:MAG TPA: adenylate kinase [Acidobacteriota bacterium]|nr:adenylate kinase [Acidobacteriota bacterium]